VTTQDTPGLLELLTAAGVDFVIVGGVAAFSHGSTMVTEDLDIAAQFSAENMSRLLEALRPYAPRHALTPGKQAIVSSADELARLKNLYIWSELGRLDVLGETPPIKRYKELRDRAKRVSVTDSECMVASIGDLIAMKRALARPKDLLAVEQLEAIRDSKSQS